MIQSLMSIIGMGPKLPAENRNIISLKRGFQHLLTALVVLGISGAFVACTSKKENRSSNASNVMKNGVKQGGTFYYPLSAEPERLNPINSSDMGSSWVREFTCEGLMQINIDTNDLEPSLAESVDSAPDGSWYTFHLRKGVKFHNGEEVTAEVVKWNFEAIFNDAYEAFNIRPYVENVGQMDVIDKYTIKFHIKKKYFANLRNISGIPIVPKSVYGDPKDKKANKLLVCTGPYKMEKYDKGNSITLVRNSDWWGNDGKSAGSFNTAWNFDRIKFTFVKEENLRLEMAKKGTIDFDRLTAEQYAQKAVGKPWGETVLKVKMQNQAPVSYGFIAWNFKKKMFQDRKVRRALAHLMNREEMIKKFRFGMSLPATGPWYQQSPYADPTVKAINFDPKRAHQLLTEAGWKDSDKDGLLDKVIDGKKTPFRFSMIYGSRDAEKYYTIYKEDLKKAGIDMVLQNVEWNSLVKALDEQNFEAVSLAWGGGDVDLDPKQIWHSENAKKGGSNFISYSNKEVDKLIDEGRQTLDKNDRIKVFQKVYRLIADDAPYAFMFNDQFSFYAVSARLGRPKDTFTYATGYYYWWVK